MVTRQKFLLTANLQGSGNLPHTNNVIRVTGVESVAIGSKGKRQALWVLNFAGLVEGRLKDIYQVLVFKIPDLDG